MKARRFDFYADDWLAGTMTLNPDERGIYITLVAAMYSHGGPIEKTELRRLCPCDLRVFNRSLDRLLSLSKLSLKGGYLSNKRCLTELQNSRKRVVSATQNGRKGGRPAKDINDVAKPTPNPDRKPKRKLPSPSPSPSPKEEDSEATPLPPDDPVKEIFDRGIAMLGTVRRSLLGKFCKSHGEVAVLEAIVACETERPVDPVSFFISCMASAPLKNGHNKQSPVTTLYEGAMRAADKLDRQEADRIAGIAPVIPLLDGRRSR